jgi:hypothetical protein
MNLLNWYQACIENSRLVPSNVAGLGNMEIFQCVWLFLSSFLYLQNGSSYIRENEAFKLTHIKNIYNYFSEFLWYGNLHPYKNEKVYFAYCKIKSVKEKPGRILVRNNMGVYNRFDHMEPVL